MTDWTDATVLVGAHQVDGCQEKTLGGVHYRAVDRTYCLGCLSRLLAWAAAQQYSERLDWLESRGAAMGSAIEMDHGVFLDAGQSIRAAIDAARGWEG